MNKVFLIGRLTKEPTLDFTKTNGTAKCTFTLAVDRRFKKEGQQSADFIPVVTWGKLAENIANYMGKGSLVSVSGYLEIRNYETEAGEKRYMTNVVSDEVKFLESKTKGQTNSTYTPNTFENGDMQSIDDGEDCPF